MGPSEKEAGHHTDRLETSSQSGTASAVDVFVEDDSIASLEKPMEELLPIALGTAGRIQGTAFGRPSSVSLDSGSATSWFNAESLPEGTHGHTVPQVKGSTLAGSFPSSEQVCLQDFAFQSSIQSRLIRSWQPTSSMPVVGMM